MLYLVLLTTASPIASTEFGISLVQMKNSGQISDQVGTSGVRFDTHTENELQNSSSVLFRQLVMFSSHGPVAMKEVHPQ